MPILRSGEGVWGEAGNAFAPQSVVMEAIQPPREVDGLPTGAIEEKGGSGGSEAPPRRINYSLSWRHILLYLGSINFSFWFQIHSILSWFVCLFDCMGELQVDKHRVPCATWFLSMIWFWNAFDLIHIIGNLLSHIQTDKLHKDKRGWWPNQPNARYASYWHVWFLNMSHFGPHMKWPHASMKSKCRLYYASH